MSASVALIIDDSRAIRLALSHITEQLGFQPMPFPDAESAVAWLDDGGSAMLALVDWNMPGMGGVGFLRTVRARQALEGLAIMVVTSDTGRATMELAFELGADEYLMKPITKETVRAKLQLLGFAWDETT